MPIIKSLKEHFDARAIEWGMAGWAVSWGLMVLLHPSMFWTTGTKVLFMNLWRLVEWTGTYPPTTIGLIFFILGIIRGSALLVNGLWKRTPLVRLITSAISAFLVTYILVGFAQGPPNTGTITYFWLFLADCYSARRAAEDWLKAKVAHDLLTIVPQKIKG